MILSKSKKQVLSLYISTVANIGLGVLISILNTRNLIPEDYGDVRYVSNLISLFSGFLLFGFFVTGSRLLAISKNRKEVQELKGVLFIILGVAVFLIMVIMLFTGLFHEFVLHKDYYHMFYISIPVCGNVLLLNYINTTSQGDNKIYLISLARMLPSLCYLLFGFLIYSIIDCTKELMLFLQNGIYILVLLIILYFEHPSFKNIVERWEQIKRENKLYGIQVYYGSLSNVTVQYIAGVSLGFFALDNKDVGFYTLALTISSPLATLPNIIATTYFKDFAVKNSIGKKIIYYTYFSSTIFCLFFVILIFPVVDFLYSSSYKDVAFYAAILALGSTFTGIADVYNRFLCAHGFGVEIRNSAFVSGLIQIIGYTFGIYILGILGAIYTRVFAAFSALLMQYIYYKKVTKMGIK